jgi:hypothetical protein
MRGYYALIVRIYKKDFGDAVEGMLPKVVCGGGETPLIITPYEKRLTNTAAFNDSYLGLIAIKKRVNPIRLKKNYLEFQVPDFPIVHYFPNKLASYLYYNVFSTDVVIRIRGRYPVAEHSGISYISFMACDFATTATNDCIGSNILEKTTDYVIFVAATPQLAIERGYAPMGNTFLLLWDANNKNPILIYREIKRDVGRYTPAYYMPSVEMF